MSKWTTAKSTRAMAFVALVMSPPPSVTQTDGLYNVKTYGAQGDGASDDTVAITAALGAVNNIKTANK